LPGISDPGARLIGAALEGGVPVTVLPGASAVDTALVASGFAADRYQFVGFLPRGERALRRAWEELARWPWPAVAFESPRRLPATLRSLAAVDPERRLAVCRELTKRHEQVARGSARELARQFAEAPKGEVTLVLGPGGGERGQAKVVAAAEAVAELASAGVARSQAAAVVSRLTGLPRKRLYDTSL
jgi:16S rRNA (cytidine1402-2'-O)-methyltransferase